MFLCSDRCIISLASQADLWCVGKQTVKVIPIVKLSLESCLFLKLTWKRTRNPFYFCNVTTLSEMGYQWGRDMRYLYFNVSVFHFSLFSSSFRGARRPKQSLLFLWNHLLRLWRKVQPQWAVPDDTWLPDSEGLGSQHGEQATGNLSGMTLGNLTANDLHLTKPNSWILRASLNYIWLFLYTKKDL